MRPRIPSARCLLALLQVGGALVHAALSNELCEATSRELQGSALLQKERSRTRLRLADVKHPDLTDGGPLPWKPDDRTSPRPSISLSSTTTMTTTAATTSKASAMTTTTSGAIVINISNVSSVGNESNASSVGNTSSATSVGNKSGGCCFSFGFGSMMEPCCLKTNIVSDRSDCLEADLVGGRTSFTVGECPGTPEEAAAVVEAADDMKKQCTPGNSCGEGVLPKDRGLCIQTAEGPSACWDICDTSHMPEEYTLGDGDEDFAKKLAQAVQDVRDGKYEELSCPAEGDEEGTGTNGTLTGDSFEDQLAAAATQASQADSIADEATVLAEQMLAEARNDFAKAMSDGATPENLAGVAKKWQDVAAAHKKAYTAAATVAESIKALSQLLATGSSRAAKELEIKKDEAAKKEALARKKADVAAQKREEAEEAKALAMKALAEAQKARAEANSSSSSGTINIAVGEDVNATLNWNTSWNGSSEAAAEEE